MCALALAAPASGATPPDVQRFQFSYTGVVDCPGFEDLFSGSGTDIIQFYFDSSGNLVRARDHLFIVETDVNSVTGKSIVDRIDQVADVTIVNGEVTGIRLSGASALVNVAGSGIVIHDSGMVIFDANGNPTFIAGPHQHLINGQQPFCDALA
jgi:hypothetical protein